MIISKCKLSEDILAALMVARQLQMQEVEERLLQALEVMAAGENDDEELCTAYLALVAPTPTKGLQ